MAQFFPSIEKIPQFRVQPTEGEWYLLRFLENTLDDSFEVYFNPFLNGDRPDVVIMRKRGGVLIIEVKDWDLELYQLDEKKHWHLKHPKNGAEARAYIKSPIDQAIQYKKNLYNIHVEKLFESNIKDPKLWGVVTCGVYFHNASHKQIQSLLVTPYKDNQGYQKFIKNIELLGRDDLEENGFKKMLGRHHILTDRPSYLFQDSLYDSIHHLLLPPLHLQTQGRFISRYDGRLKKQNPQMFMYSKKQDELIFDEKKRKEWRVKGVVGSGKTTLLAAKAVQAYRELLDQGIKHPKILILTYNITLKNFIHDKIQQVQAEFDWESFTILNYHQFIKSQLNNLGIVFRRDKDETDESFFARYYDNYQLFADRKDKTERFDVIFIDEIQDYKRVWMNIIKDCFLCVSGEYPQGGYYLLGDVKQNIYNRRISDKDVVTNVLGVNTLETCFRSYMKIKDLALGFEGTYFDGKYDIDTTLTSEQDSLFAKQNLQQGYLNYKYLQNLQNKDLLIRSVFNIVEDNIKKRMNNVAINDITILGVELEFLKLFETYYRYKTGLRTSTMFETYEIMFLQGIKSIILTFEKLKSALVKLMKRDNDQNADVEQDIASLLSAYEMYSRFPDEFRKRLESKCIEYNCSLHDFLAIMTRYELRELKSALVKLVKRDNDQNADRAEKNIASLLSAYEMYSRFPDEFRIRLESKCIEYRCSLHDFLAIMTRYEVLYNKFREQVFNADYDSIRDNKKFHFWMNTGNIKISSIHSFKGWESDTIFLILQPRKEGDPSFDELLYTGITRTISNLVVINLGNHEYHENMERLIETYR